MDRAEFVKTCKLCGYCTKEQAEKYAVGKEEFSERDFEEAYRRFQSKICDGKWRPMRGRHKTTKHFFREVGNR